MHRGNCNIVLIGLPGYAVKVQSLKKKGSSSGACSIISKGEGVMQKVLSYCRTSGTALVAAWQGRVVLIEIRVIL